MTSSARPSKQPASRRPPIAVRATEAESEPPIDLRAWAQEYVALLLELDGRGTSETPAARMGA